MFVLLEKLTGYELVCFVYMSFFTRNMLVHLLTGTRNALLCYVYRWGCLRSGELKLRISRIGAITLGLMTFSITTLSIMTFSMTINNATVSIMTFNVYTECCYVECHD